MYAPVVDEVAPSCVPECTVEGDGVASLEFHLRNTQTLRVSVGYMGTGGRVRWEADTVRGGREGW